MTIPDVRFSDKMVRGNASLKDVAWAYARDYKGDWEVMVAAHDLAMETNELPVPIARMVLNVMRADPAAQHLLPRVSDAKVLSLDDFRRDPESYPHQNWGSIDADEVDLREPNGGKGKPPPEPRYSMPRVISLRWHVRYALSTHKMAKVAHIIRTSPPSDRRGDAQYGWTNIRWVPMNQAFDVQIKAWCSANWISWRYRYRGAEEINYIEGINNLGVILTTDTQGRPICKSCTFNEERFLERENQL